jgi:glycosyltransferase involved in cell wall biosynthesis
MRSISMRSSFSDEPAEPESCPHPKYSVVIPFYNEAANAAALLEEVNATLSSLAAPYEVLMVDDGSADQCAEILAEIAAAQPQCKLIRLSPNGGQAAALYRGLKAATAPLIITLDGDGQNCPGDIPQLLPGLENADMVVGVRVNRQDGWLRRKISSLANAVRGRLLGDGMSDSGCALKVFRREVISAFIPIRTLYSFMPAMAVAGGFRVAEAPVRHRARGGGKSSYGLRVFLWRPVLDLLGVWWFTRRRFREARTAPGQGRGSLRG